jgi:hypothetical protein
MSSPSTSKTKPTLIAHGELQQAFDVFNEKLFAGELPQCMITMQRVKPWFGKNRKDWRIAGYCAHKRFAKSDNQTEVVDEIAMNPNFFYGENLVDGLSTLVHEMVHQWQNYFGKPSRKSYHNAEWGRKMEAVGLMPSHTGRPGGRKTGQLVMHYIIDGGPFDVAAEELVGSGFRLSYYDTSEKKAADHEAEVAAWRHEREIKREAEAAAKGEPYVPILFEPKPTKSGERVKYACPGCQSQVWGRSGLSIRCDACCEPFLSGTDREERNRKDAELAAAEEARWSVHLASTVASMVLPLNLSTLEQLVVEPELVVQYLGKKLDHVRNIDGRRSLPGLEAVLRNELCELVGLCDYVRKKRWSGLSDTSLTKIKAIRTSSSAELHALVNEVYRDARTLQIRRMSVAA